MISTHPPRLHHHLPTLYRGTSFPIILSHQRLISAQVDWFHTSQTSRTTCRPRISLEWKHTESGLRSGDGLLDYRVSKALPAPERVRVAFHPQIDSLQEWPRKRPALIPAPAPAPPAGLSICALTGHSTFIGLVWPGPGTLAGFAAPPGEPGAWAALPLADLQRLKFIGANTQNWALIFRYLLIWINVRNRTT